MAGEITPEVAFDNLKKNVVDSISSHFPFEGKTQRLELKNIWVDDKLSIDDLKGQAQAKDMEKTWGVPVKADVALVDKTTGKVVDKRTVMLARLPKLTSRYGFIVDGQEYQVDHLFRLKSGVYARVQENGDLESEFNLVRGPAGNRFSIHLDRESKRFSIKQGDSHIPLYPVLKAMGVADEQLQSSWGPDILAANKPKTEEKFNKVLQNFHKKTSFDEETPQDPTALVKYIQSFFGQTQLRPDTTKVTLGKPFSSVNGEALRLAADKILGVSRGTNPPDDRDSLAFKEIVSAEDFIAEKIQRSERAIKARIRQTVDHKKSVVEVVSPDLFGKPVREFFIKGGSLAERSDQTNPIQMLSGHRKTTLMAADLGGIKSTHSLTDEMRVINPSHFGFLDPMHTPESEKTGVTLHLGLGVRKNGKDLETPAYDLKSGKMSYVKAQDFHGATAVLPDQVRWQNGKPVPIASKVKVKLPGGAIEVRPFSEATHVMPSAKGLFSPASNLIPFLQNDQGNRVSMADKQMEQAIAIKHREIPLVQTKTDGKSNDHTFENVLGAFSSHRAPVSGKVVAVKPESIVIQDGKKKHEVHLYNHFPLNDPKGMMHSEVLVKPGDAVKAGQLLADTNFTRNGTLALGSNLRVGYIPYKGYNYEDGIVISESAAKKLTSEHLHKKRLDVDPDNDIVSKDKFLAFSATKAASLTKDQLAALDEHGVVKVGTRVQPGDILVAAVGKNLQGKTNSALAALGKRAFQPYKDKSLTWDEDHVGVVTKVVKDPTGKGFKVYVKTEEPMVIGDKMAGRHGNKGIVTQILPDHEMPFTVDPKSGEKRHLEVLLNPSGVPTRINVGQILETAASKIAEKTGKPYVVENFAGPNMDYRKQVEKDLKAHGLNDEEAVFDPNDPRRPLGSVLVGNQYLLKLKHQVEKKLTVRGGGTDLYGKPLKYDVDHQPTKGVDGGGQGFGALDVYALLGHNARANLREMATIKSDAQDASFWNMVQEGHEPPPPKVPFSYEKFMALLKGAGINVEKKGTSLQLLPMTDKHVLDLAGGTKGEIKNAHLTLRSKDLKEERHGLFDPIVTGGMQGNKWGYIKMSEPMPNPIFIGSNNRPGPIPVLLGLKMSEMDAVMRGTQQLNGKTGGDALAEALKKVNVDAELAKIKTELPRLTGPELDRGNRKLKYLQALKEANLKPHEAYILNYLPVVPPAFRPVTSTPKGDLHYASLNGLYKNFAIINNKLGEFDKKTFSEDHKAPLRYALYDSLRALQSVGGSVGYDTDSPGGKRKLKGILDTIGGGDEQQPKEGFFQSKLVKRRQNLAIRSTIIPEPKLGLDEVGLPRNAAMELYKPFVVAEMGRMGFKPLEAQTEMRKGTSVAFKALEKVVADRPLILKRDPALHKFSVMAFKPILIDGKAIQIHPLVTGGFNADFDGDTMAGTVPLTREAVEEAKKMFPSQNLFSPTTGKVLYTPSQDMMLGLHLLTKWGPKTNKTFKDPIEANKAFDQGHIGQNDVIKIGGKETTLGRLRIAARLPNDFSMKGDLLYKPDFNISKGTLGDIVSKLAKNHQRDFAQSVNDLKDLGNEHAFKAGFSFGLKDLTPLQGRDTILNEAHKKADAARKVIKDPEKLEQQLIDIYQKATSDIDALAKKKLSGGENRLATMVYSGARGKSEQLRQMIAAPMLMQDAHNRTIPTPVTKSYAEGLDLGDYWLTQNGARKGTLQRTLGTSEPGVISKDIINTTMSTLVTSPDCGTPHGVLMELGHKDLHDRFTATSYKVKDGTIPPGTLITPEISARLRNAKVDKVLVRTPLKCQHGDGICAKCFGLNESGKPHEIGTNIGVLAGQALSEPAVQMAMDAFHSGGVAAGRGAVSVDRFARLRQLLQMPKKLKNSATLARTNGQITAIKPDAVGGVDIYINNERHYVPKHLIDPSLKVGQTVKRGTSLSYGGVNPHQLLEHTGDIHAVQNYLTNELYGGLYEKEGVRRRNVEVVVRGLTNLARIKDPGDSSFAFGDVVPRSIIDEHNKNKPSKPVVADPILRGITQIPMTGSTDWMARLNYRELATTLTSGAAQGWKSDLHGSHPIPALAHGKEFGKPPATLPKHRY